MNSEAGEDSNSEGLGTPRRGLTRVLRRHARQAAEGAVVVKAGATTRTVLLVVEVFPDACVLACSSAQAMRRGQVGQLLTLQAHSVWSRADPCPYSERCGKRFSAHGRDRSLARALNGLGSGRQATNSQDCTLKSSPYPVTDVLSPTDSTTTTATPPCIGISVPCNNATSSTPVSGQAAIAALQPAQVAPLP